jgi:uncharacterized membrane protein
MAGLCTPLPTLHLYPHRHLRTARGQHGSLLLHCKGLSPSTPCRFYRRTNENFYTSDIDHVAKHEVGLAFGGYKYLPMMPLVYGPLGLTLGNAGMLLTKLLLDFAIAALIFVAARRDGGRAAGLIAVAAYLSLPLVFGVLYAKFATDLLPVSLLLGSVFAGERRPLLAGLLLGLSVSSKLLPGLAASPACVPLRGRGSFGLGFAVGLLPTLVAWFSAPRAFIDNIVLFNALRPVDTSSWMWGLAPQASGVSRLAFALVWLALAIFAVRYATSVTTRSSLVVLLLVTVMLGGPTVHQNYILWLIPFLCIALAVTGVSNRLELREG